jgi:hypothetical protein
VIRKPVWKTSLGGNKNKFVVNFKENIKEKGVRISTGFIWLRTGFSVGLL